MRRGHDGPTFMRPHVICHMLSSLDGHTNGEHWKIKNTSSYFEKQAEKIKVDAWLVGRVTMQEFSSKKAFKAPKGKWKIPKSDWVAPHEQKTYAVVIDPKGKNHFDAGHVSTEHVITVLSTSVSSSYLAHLREKNVSYLFAGAKEIDLEVALEKLRAQWGIKRVRVDGGGRVNGSFLEAGLIDELSLVVMPVADGSIGANTIFDVGPNGAPTHFTLNSVKRLDGGVLWLRYTTKK